MYITVCPLTTIFGSFVCVYVAVVDVSSSSSLVFTSGTLSVTSLSSIFVMNFLNDRSNLVGIITSKSSSSSLVSLLSGVESLSSPSSLVISAIFLSTFDSDVATLNSIFTSA